MKSVVGLRIGGYRANLCRLRSRLSRNKFASGVLTLFTGAAAVQMIGVLATPVMARIYSPTVIGLAAVLISIVTILSGIASLKYEQAIPLPAIQEQRAAVAGLCVVLLLVVSGGFSLLLLVDRSWLGRLFGEPALAEYLWVAPVGIFLVGGLAILLQWFIREQRFRDIVRTRLYQSVGQIGYQIGGGLLTAGSVGILMTGYVLGHVLGILNLLWRDRSLPSRVLKSSTIQSLKQSAHTYKKFPLYTSWSTLIDRLAPMLPLLAMAALFSTREAGIYRVAQSLIAIPVAALSGSIASVYWSESAKLVHENPTRLYALYRRLTLQLLGVGGLLISGSILLPYIVPVLLGSRWADVGDFAIIVAVPAAVGLPCGIAVNLPLLDRNGWELAWNVGRVGLLGCGVFVAQKLSFDAVSTMILMAAVLVFAYAVLIVLNLFALKAHAARWKDTLPQRTS